MAVSVLHWMAFSSILFILTHQFLHISHPFLITSSSLVIFYLLYASYLYPYYLSPLRNVPTAPGALPIFGHFFIIFNNEMALPQRDWHRKYGPIFRFWFPLGFERICIADDEAIKEITVRGPYNYPRPARITKWMASVLGPEGVLLVDGEEHVRQRKIIAPAFSTAAIRDLMPIFWDKALHMTQLLLNKFKEEGDAQSSQSFELLDWINRTTLDIISLAAFGHEINSLDNPEHEIRVAYRDIFQSDMSATILQFLMTFSMAFRELPFKMCQSMRRAQTVITRVANHIIKDKLNHRGSSSAKSKDIIGLIVKASEKQSSQLPFSTLRDQVMAFLGAGHDTTATAVAWTLHLLSKHPDIQTRLRHEIKTHMPNLVPSDPNISLDTLRSQLTSTVAVEHILANVDALPYLENVCRESLRFIPPIPLTSRVNIRPVTLVGHAIPAGTLIQICSNAINHLENFWGSTASVFDPDRWDTLPDTWVPNAFLTFMAGPRGCIGRNFAEMEMKVLICAMVGHFVFERDEGFGDPEVGKMWRLVLRPREGMNLRVRRVVGCGLMELGEMWGLDV